MNVNVRLTGRRVAFLLAGIALRPAGVAFATTLVVTSNVHTDAQGVYHGCVKSDSRAFRLAPRWLPSPPEGAWQSHPLERGGTCR